MITSLTPDQTNKFPQYVEAWTNRGLTTARQTIENAVKDFTDFQKYILKRGAPAPVVLLDSPTKCWIAVLSVTGDHVSNQVWNQVSDQVWNQVWNQVSNQVSDQVWNQVRNQVLNQVRNQVLNQVDNQVLNQVDNQVRNQVWNQVSDQVWKQVRDQVSDQVSGQVRDQVSGQVWKQVRNQVRNQVWNQVGRIVYPYFDCQFWAGFFSFYDFFKNELCINFPNNLEYETLKKCTSYGMVWPLENLCVVCQPPTIINKNERGLHCENGPALSYNGDNEIWALNGITVPKELVLTPSEELSIDFFKNEKNADVKAEFVRKYGVERMLDMGKIVDSYENYPDQTNYSWWWKSEYELWDMSAIFEGIPYQPYLKMKNQTTGVWHVEAVSPNCKTLSEAVKERFGGREMKIVSIK